MHPAKMVAEQSIAKQICAHANLLHLWPRVHACEKMRASRRPRKDCVLGEIRKNCQNSRPCSYYKHPCSHQPTWLPEQLKQTSNRVTYLRPHSCGSCGERRERPKAYQQRLRFSARPEKQPKLSPLHSLRAPAHSSRPCKRTHATSRPSPTVACWSV